MTSTDDANPSNAAMNVAWSSAAESEFLPGRRSFLSCRDLGVTSATHGRMRAQITKASSAMPRPTGWHTHLCEMQFTFMLKGWAEIELEDGRTLRMQAGDSLMIPGGVRHQEVRSSNDFEFIEISVPADMGTAACEAPTKANA